MADFFRVLEMNEAPRFHLFYDDLPIYYVSSEHKDKIYLMANLFTKCDLNILCFLVLRKYLKCPLNSRYHVSDEMAFPLLLRGLSPTYEWIDLARAEVPKAEEAERPVVDSPQVSKLDIPYVLL